MALQERRTEIPFGAGQAEQVAPELVEPPMLRSAVNVRFGKEGRLSKRYGYTALSLTTLSGGSLTQGVRLVTRGDELGVIDGHYIYSREPVGSTLVQRDRVPECQLARQRIVSDYTAGNLPHCDAVYCNGVRVVAYEDANNDTITAVVTRDSTGALVSRTTLTTGGAFARLVVMGTKVGVVWSDTGGTNLAFRVIDTAALSSGWASATNIVTNATTGVALFDVTADGTSGFFVANQRTASGACDVRRFDTTGTQTHATLGVAASITAVCLAYTGSVLFVGYADTVTGNVEVIGKTNVLASQFTARVLEATATSVRMCAGIRTSGTDVWIVWYRANTSPTTPATYWRGVDTVGTMDTNTHQTGLIKPGGRPFVVDGRSYLPVYHALAPTVMGPQQGAMLVDIGLGTDGTDYRARPVARWGIGDLYDPFLTNHVPSSSPTADAGTYLVGFMVTDFASTGTGRGAGVDVAVLSLSPSTLADDRWLNVEVADAAVVCAALPHFYSGEQCCELGYAWYPWIVSATPTTGVGTLPADTYDYVVCYEYRDSRGYLHQSQPSAQTSATLGSTGKVELLIPHLTVTSKDDADGSYATPVSIVVYRRTGTNEFKRLADAGTSALDTNDPTATAYLTFVDDGAYADTNQPFLYTQGGVLENWTPPAARYTTVWDGRVWFASAEDDRAIWYSSELLRDEAPRFNAALAFRIDADGPVTGIASMDSSLVVFKREAIYWMQGTGPNDRGEGSSYTQPQRVSSDVGCVDARTIVLTRLGLMFQSRQGLYLLTRGMELRYLSGGVEDTLVTYPTITSAAVDRITEEARFSVANEDAGRFVCFDLQTAEWTLHDVFQPNEYTAVDSAWVGGVYTWLHSAGTVVQQDTSSFMDTTGVTDYWVEQSIETADIKLDGLQGFQRIWAVTLLGRKLGDHGLTVEVAYDRAGTFAQTFTWTEAQVTALPTLPQQQMLMEPRVQECQTIRLRIRDTEPAASADSESFAVLGALLEYGVERGTGRLGAPHRKG